MLELTIDDLGAQGDGIAHHGGQTVFVAGALPHERVRVRLAENGSGQQRAAIEAILEPNGTRIKPPCHHYPHCGGCRLQHMKGAAVTAWKVEQLKHALEAAAFTDIPFYPAVVTATGTRRRARLAAEHAPQGIILGFNAWRSHELIDLKECTVLLPDLTAFVQKLRDALPSWLPQGQSCDVQITALPEGFDVVLIGGPPLGLDQRQELAILAENLNIAQLSWRKWDRSPVEPIAHRQPLFVTYGKTPVPFPPGSFLQATVSGENALIGFTRDAIGDSAKIMDLFCGLGGFGLSMPKAKKVNFSDLDGAALDSLRRVVKQNPNWHVEQRNLISDPFKADELGAFDAVIFDPPRGGAKALTMQLANSTVPTIVAISCDPSTFARDARILTQGGYALKALLPVDQFLWSTHLELAAWFEKIV